MKVLCFSPNDAVWRWTLPQAQLLETLKRRGDEIVYVYCDREFSQYCMSMASSGVSFSADAAAKEAICKTCVSNSELVRSQFGFESRPLRAFISAEERSQADAASRDLSMQQMIDYIVAEIPVGKFALYETVIQTKSISVNLSPEAERFYRANFRNTCLTAFATRRMLDEIKPDIGLSYHTAYAYNRAFQSMMEARGIPVWFANASFSVAELDTHLVVARSDPEKLFRKLLADWPKFSDVASRPEEIGAAADHLVELMRGGGFAFSRAMSRRSEDALQSLGCPRDKKIVLAMLSSYDELLAADVAGFGWSTKNAVFGSQIEWVEWLFGFARSRDDIHIVIRVHPREFAIRGKGGRSEHSYMLEAAFAKRPVNVSINLPDDNIALYDVLVEADLALVAWSSAGMEAGMLGLPVVTYAGDVTLFPRSLAYDAVSRSQYEVLVRAAIEEGWSIERARAFLRWAVLMFVRTRIDLTNGAPIPVRRGPLRSFLTRLRNRALSTLTPWSRERWSIALRQRRLRDAPRIHALFDRGLDAFQDAEVVQRGIGHDEELAAVRRELSRIAGLIEKGRGRKAMKLEMLIAAGAAPAITGHAGSKTRKVA